MTGIPGASDVIHKARVVPLIKDGLKDGDVSGEEVASSQFLPGVEWLSPAYVADKLGCPGTGRRQRRRASRRPVLHGTGLQSVSAGTVTLQPSGANRIPASTRAFAIKFTNQGEKRRVRRPRRAHGRRRLQAHPREPHDQPGAQGPDGPPRTSSSPPPPPVGVPVTITAEVKSVPGEKKTDNNKGEYQALFVQ
jgi:hypothetical protein